MKRLKPQGLTRQEAARKAGRASAAARKRAGWVQDQSVKEDQRASANEAAYAAYREASDRRHAEEVARWESVHAPKAGIYGQQQRAAKTQAAAKATWVTKQVLPKFRTDEKVAAKAVKAEKIRAKSATLQAPVTGVRQQRFEAAAEHLQRQGFMWAGQTDKGHHRFERNGVEVHVTPTGLLRPGKGQGDYAKLLSNRWNESGQDCMLLGDHGHPPGGHAGHGK